MPIITISRGTFSGAESLAQSVSACLGIPCLSREIIVEAARHIGVSEEVFEETLERPPSFFERFSNMRDIYLAFVRSALLEQARQGSFVYHGNNVHLLLSELPNVIRVRVIAPMSFRVGSVMKRRGLGQREAERYVQRIDKQRAKWIRFLYQVQSEDPALYDLTINLELLEIQEACDLVCNVAGLQRLQWTDRLQQQVSDLALASRVPAQLAHDSPSSKAELEVTAQSGVVKIRGSIRFPQTREAILKTAGKIPGAEQVQCEVTLPLGHCHHCQQDLADHVDGVCAEDGP
jgi:cytidylate kinase